MTDLEEQIVARLDGLVEAVAALHADVHRLLEACTAPPEPILEPVDADWVCQWPNCGVAVDIGQAEASSEWSGKILCRLHDERLMAIREAKRAAAG